MNGSSFVATPDAATAASSPPWWKDKTIVTVLIGFTLSLATAAIEISSLAGLPAHPLFLHVPVVIVPAFAAATIALLAKPVWRKTYGTVLAMGGFAALIGTNLTVAAGEAFQEQKERFFDAIGGGRGSQELQAIHEHGELGDQLRIVVVLLVALVVAIVIIDRLVAMRDAGQRVPAGGLAGFLTGHIEILMKLAAVAGIMLSALAITWTFRAGHAGAKITFGEETGAAVVPAGDPNESRGVFPGPPANDGDGDAY